MPWHSLNLSISRGDELARVHQNRDRLAAAIGVEAQRLVNCRQVHGTTVAKVDESDAGTRQEATDGLITDTVGLPLSLIFADCVPILLYDPVRHALGVCHAGWRGTLNGVAVATLWALQAAYGTEPAHVKVGIGPSIGPASYQVGDEVVALAQAKLRDADQYLSYPAGPTARPHLDLWRANAGLLQDAGVQGANIEISAIDTAQRTDDFFSHRAEQGRCGLFGMMAWLEPRP
jgi:YfiH family protein